MQYGDENESYIDQLDINNFARSTVTGDLNFVDIDQNGTNSEAKVSIGPEDSYEGDENNVRITQHLGGKAWVTLHGSSNDVNLLQSGGSGDWHVVKVMKGDDNDFDITAENGGGNRGYWLLRWASSDNDIDVSQDGSGNVAGGYLEGASSNVIDIVQSGNDNLVGSDPHNWNVNDGVVITNGTGNNIDVDQLTDGNMATANVAGSSNTVTISQ